MRIKFLFGADLYGPYSFQGYYKLDFGKSLSLHASMPVGLLKQFVRAD